MEIRLISQEDSYLTFNFYSNNGVPILLIEKMSEKFPLLTFQFHSYSILDDYMANFHFEKGEARFFKQGEFEDFGIKNDYRYQDKEYFDYEIVSNTANK